MSSKTKAPQKKTARTAPARKAAPIELLPGADILVKCLEKEGVKLIFAYPGGASMPIHQALTRSKQIRTVLPRHEQGGSFAAEGYARVTGRTKGRSASTDTSSASSAERLTSPAGGTASHNPHRRD